MKLGIVAILNPDVDSSKGPPSIRRTLSAEVLVGFASAAVDSSSDGEQDDLWGGCIWRNNLRPRTDPRPPYVHPRLSERSLEMCTESLGSETGSDYFSSSEWMSEGEKLGHEINGGDRGKALSAARCKKLPETTIPPPISVSLRVRSRRENGRLVLEAVSVLPQRHFKVQRGNGRLVLTLINSPSVERVPAAVGGGDGEVMKKLMAIGNSNPQFSGKVIEEGFRLPRMIQSPAATFINAYDYFWRKKGGGADGEKKANQNRELMVMMVMNGGCKEARRRSVSIWNPYCIAT